MNEPGPIDLVERIPVPAGQDAHRAWLPAWVLVCALGAAFCIGLAIWLDANLPTITECRL